MLLLELELLPLLFMQHQPRQPIVLLDLLELRLVQRLLDQLERQLGQHLVIELPEPQLGPGLQLQPMPMLADQQSTQQIIELQRQLLVLLHLGVR